MLIKHNVYTFYRRRKEEDGTKVVAFMRTRANHQQPRTHSHTFSAQRFEIRRTQRLGEGDAAVARVHVGQGGRLNGIDSRWGGGCRGVCALGDEGSVVHVFFVSMVVS